MGATWARWRRACVGRWRVRQTGVETPAEGTAVPRNPASGVRLAGGGWLTERHRARGSSPASVGFVAAAPSRGFAFNRSSPVRSYAPITSTFSDPPQHRASDALTRRIVETERNVPGLTRTPPQSSPTPRPRRPSSVTVMPPRCNPSSSPYSRRSALPARGSTTARWCDHTR